MNKLELKITARIRSAFQDEPKTVTMWKAVDADGSCFLYPAEPYRHGDRWACNIYDTKKKALVLDIPGDVFAYPRGRMTWEKEPRKVVLGEFEAKYWTQLYNGNMDLAEAAIRRGRAKVRRMRREEARRVAEIDREGMIYRRRYLNRDIE